MGYFSVGDSVEVVGHEDGFWGSYYEAKIIKQSEEEQEGDQFLVEYQTLEDDDKNPIQQTVNAKYLRPVPPQISKVSAAAKFKLNDAVDVWANDRWWVGRVMQVVPHKHKYTGSDRTRVFVWFDSTQEEIDYQLCKLRVHQDWDINGDWVLMKKQEDNNTKKRSRFGDDYESSSSSVLQQQQGSKKIFHTDGVCTSWTVETY
ncbi:hypothetical protein MKW94_018907 [Papaver nudicaule]|uniref:Agenet domain-containing protein n=1 Tax=Papaver nudicaule TaxID=74823 RepID=A0AA41VSQ2_PAPNU|nr:hypothetical protein [Papaver nudicaule]